MDVSWIKCGNDGHWCSLDRLELNSIEVGGVYIIWHEGNPGRVVRIGQGDIADRLCAHRNDKEIIAYRKSGALRATWAAVPLQYRNGVERYLANTWEPLVGSAFPIALPLAVNSPWG